MFKVITSEKLRFLKEKPFVNTAIVLGITAINTIGGYLSIDTYFLFVYICWIMAGVFTVINSTKNEKAFAFSFLFVMVGNLLDSQFFAFNILGYNELSYLFIVPLIFYSVWRFGGRNKIEFTKWSLVLTILTIYSTLIRNDVFVPYMHLGDVSDVFFKGDAILWAIFGAYAVRHTHGVSRIITGGVFALIMSNLADELVLYPLSITVSEVTTAIYVAYMTLMFALRYKLGKSSVVKKWIDISNLVIHLLIVAYFLDKYYDIILIALKP